MIHDYLDAKETAEMLRCSRSNVYLLATRKRDPLPGKRLGGKLLFQRADIEEWIARQPNIAAGQIADAPVDTDAQSANVIPFGRQPQTIIQKGMLCCK
jgi:excisionase family DNA binding protein